MEFYLIEKFLDFCQLNLLYFDNDVKPLVISGQKFEQIYFPVISSTGNIKPMHCVILLSVKNNYLVKITSCTQKLTYAEIDSQLSKLIKIEK